MYSWLRCRQTGIFVECSYFSAKEQPLKPGNFLCRASYPPTLWAFLGDADFADIDPNVNLKRLIILSRVRRGVYAVPASSGSWSSRKLVLGALCT